MENMTDPQSEREWLIRLSGQIDNLTRSIDGLGDKMVDIERTQIAALRKEIENLKVWKQQISGGWKAIVAVWVIITAIGLGAIIKLFSK